MSEEKNLEENVLDDAELDKVSGGWGWHHGNGLSLDEDDNELKEKANLAGSKIIM